TLKLISTEEYDFTGKTYAEMLAVLIGEKDASDIREKTARFLDLSIDSYAIKALDWLGIFDEKPMNRGVDTAFEITSDLMIEKMSMDHNGRDMVVMQHVFLASYPDGKKEVIRSSMLDFGSLAEDTAVARTVALPAAIGVEMILNDEITVKGVHIPVIPDIYNPILDALENLDIKMVEEYGLSESEGIFM
ncbi:saccharopine dehydrogenase C-terminal domain-containing protein, partial [Arthrospira platensis SPKY1]|nr:saccharopine dehydrogenase C-terminal domain-containing protein [Arthrospira platensis SPKY1]